LAPSSLFSLGSLYRGSGCNVDAKCRADPRVDDENDDDDDGSAIHDSSDGRSDPLYSDLVSSSVP